MTQTIAFQTQITDFRQRISGQIKKSVLPAFTYTAEHVIAFTIYALNLFIKDWIFRIFHTGNRF